MAKFKLLVNGAELQAEAPDEMPLLWVLRDKLGLRGAKFGCGVGACGACTVHLDGAAVRSCVLPVSAVGQRNITTIEGLSGTRLHPVQQAWIDEQVAQCGYCQAGQIMQAASLIANNPAPNIAEIDEAMAGNLCRCGTYPRIQRAILRAAELSKGKA